MAIIKQAQNLYITIYKKYDSHSSKFVETAEKVEIVATDNNLVLASNQKIQIKGNKE